MPELRPIRALIVDDERLARVALRAALDAFAQVEVVGEAATASEAVALIDSVEHDVVFLDVQMPGGSGFDVLERTHRARAVVFVTARTEHAVRAFEVNALDYLVKPVEPAPLARALARLGDGSPASTVTEAGPSPAPRLRLDDTAVLRDGAQVRFVKVSNIVCIRSADEYSEVHVVGRPPTLASATMRTWEARLPPKAFLRVHRTAIVNLEHVLELRSVDRRWTLSVQGVDEDLPVSRVVAGRIRQAAGELVALDPSPEDG